MANRTQQYHQFQDLNQQEQQEIQDNSKPNSNLNRLENSDKNLLNFEQPQLVYRSGNLNTLDSQLSNMKLFDNLRSLKVSDYTGQEIIETFQMFSKLVIMDPREFFLEFESWIKQMSQKWQQKLDEQDLLAYLYMEKNIFRILGESLLKYYQKNEDNRLKFGELEEYLKNGEILNSKMIDLHFSNQFLIHNVNRFVQEEFDHNIPDDVQYINYFKDIWEDLSQAKLRELNPQLKREKERTKYHYIYAWDQIYSRFVFLLKSTDSKESNIFSMINKLQQNQNGNGSNQNEQPIQQIQKQEQEKINYQELQQLKIQEQIEMDLILSQQLANQFKQSDQQMKQSNNSQSQSNNAQKQQKKEKTELQLLQEEQKQREMLQRLNYQNQLYNQKHNPHIEQVEQKYIDTINLRLSSKKEEERQEIMISTLGDLMYKDLDSLLKQKQGLSIELVEFHHFMAKKKQIQYDYNCGILNLARFHFHTKNKSNYLIEFMDNKLQKHLFWIGKEILIIKEVINKLKQSIKDISYNLQGSTSYE